MSGSDEKLQRRLEELTLALQASDARFRNVVTATTDGIIIVDEQGVIRFANPAAASLFGRGEENLLGEIFGFPVVAGETTELDVVRKGAGAVVEVRITDTGWEGRPARLLTLREITDRRRAETELRKMYRAVLDSPNMVMITDHRGGIEFVNPSFTDVTGYTLPEVAGREPSFLRSDQVAPEVYEEMLAAIRARNVWRGELVSTKKNGEHYWESVSIAPVRDLEGNVVNFIAISQEITERKQAEEDIKRLNADLAARAAELEAANTELEAFNYTVAHDLRQPLNIIGSYCQVIKELCSARLDEPCKEYIAETYKVTMRMNGIISALLNFSRMGHIEPRREIVNLSSLAHDVVSTLRQTEPERQVDVRINDKITAHADKKLLVIVLNNLIGNAWKYTGARSNAVIEFDMTDNSGSPVYLVRDNGAGFGKGDADKLFLPFQRLHGHEQFKGFGIGLATVQRIIRHHGGRIWAEGEPGRGATFYFSLSE